MKKFKLIYEVNMCAEHIETITIKANTERKAKKFAEDKLMKKFFYISFISCEEVRDETF